jgi:hypothetical protein
VNMPVPSKEDASLIALALRRQAKTHSGRIGYYTNQAKQVKWRTAMGSNVVRLLNTEHALLEQAEEERRLAGRYKMMAEYYEELAR